MPGETTIDCVKPGTEFDEHTEGIALFSPRNCCYGQELHELIEELKPNLTNYGETIQVAPYGDCLDLIVDCTVDENRTLLENSIWLIDCECILKKDLLPHFQYILRTTFPYAGNAIIWVDEGRHNVSEEDEAEIETLSTKTKVVYCKEDLLDKMEGYLEFSVNPHFTSGNIVEWKNEVHRIQRTLG